MVRHRPQGIRRRSFVIGLAGAGCMAPAQAQDSTLRIPFTPGPAGLPAGFSIARTGKGAAAAWTAIADPDVPGGYVLAQTSTDPTDDRFPLAIYDPVTAVNLAVTVRLKAVAGRVDRAGGLAIRLADAGNYYVVRANALEDNVRFYRVLKGRREQLEGANLKVTPNEWHRLGFRAEGERFTVTFDGKPLFTATDRTFAGPGKVALWTKADSVTRFDQIEIKPLP